jgi:hypothetical protein
MGWLDEGLARDPRDRTLLCDRMVHRYGNHSGIDPSATGSPSKARHFRCVHVCLGRSRVAVSHRSSFSYMTVDELLAGLDLRDEVEFTWSYDL